MRTMAKRKIPKLTAGEIAEHAELQRRLRERIAERRAYEAELERRQGRRRA